MVKKTLNDYTMRELLDMWDRSNTFIQFCNKLEEKLERENEREKAEV